MPLYTNRVAAALEAKAAAFKHLDRELKADIQRLRRGLEQIEQLSSFELETRISSPRPGALPSLEQDTQPFIVPFGITWDHHGQAREWAAHILNDVVTTAVDGSQIAPSQDVSIPVGLVQIGWFVNAHDSSGTYIKDIEVDLLAPDDLSDEDAQFGKYVVEWRRFRGEISRSIALMRANAGRRVVAFVDGPLIVSFVGKLSPTSQQNYIKLIEELLICSEETHIPVVGYTDSSYASDLVALISHVNGYDFQMRMSDAGLVDARMAWGDRLRFYICSRNDGIPNNDYYERVGFTYLKTTANHPPSRLEMPVWVLNEGLQSWVMDVIRAECIVGIGYPYPLETADALAVLSSPDRERFYQLFQQFAQQQTLPLRFSRKSISKRHRRL